MRSTPCHAFRPPARLPTAAINVTRAAFEYHPSTTPRLALHTVTLTATIYNFDITLADVDRNVYESLALRVARHPSETEQYLWVRVLAYCLEYTEGISFSKGLAEPDEPALAIRDLTGVVQAWIDIGAPDAERVHKASKASPRVVVYTHKNPAHLVRQWSGTRIHRAESVEIYGIDQAFLSALTPHLDRRTAFTLSITDRSVYLSIGANTLSTTIERFAAAS